MMKIICVDDHFASRFFPQPGVVYPVAGEIYTVRGFYTCKCGIVGYYLTEFKNPPQALYCCECLEKCVAERSFRDTRFCILENPESDKELNEELSQAFVTT